MHTCMPCPSNKGLMKQIINRVRTFTLFFPCFFNRSFCISFLWSSFLVRFRSKSCPRRLCVFSVRERQESAEAAAAIDEASEGIGGQGSGSQNPIAECFQLLWLCPTEAIMWRRYVSGAVLSYFLFVSSQASFRLLHTSKTRGCNWWCWLVLVRRCLMIGELRNGGARTTTRLWSSTASHQARLLRHQLHQMMR